MTMKRDHLRHRKDAQPDLNRLPPYEWFRALLRMGRTTTADRREWFTQLGGGWVLRGEVREHGIELANILQTATRAELDLAMTAQELETFASLPDELTVYRGCTELNRRGVAWTTSRVIAQVLAGRLRRPGDPPPARRFLLTGRVRKACGFIKLWQPSGAVMEVVAPDVEVITA